ncbi:MAG: glycerol kinase GlpK [Clostridiales bacterium]|nr:glycerol kinase GlpK [Candidatus Coliplasma caballi]
MKQYILAIDQGTTSSRCMIFDKWGNFTAVSQREIRQIFPQPGWVEHDPKEIRDTVFTVVRDAIEKAGLSAENIAAIGITNQRETTVVWEKATGKPIYNAIVWQCRRTSDLVDRLVDEEKTGMIQEKTGLIPDAYFSGTKIKWLLDNVPGAREKAENGELLFGTIDTWLIWNLTGGKVHVTDYTNASRTMLFNIKTLSWDQELLDMLGVPASMLPEVKPSPTIYGYTDEKLFGGAIPIAGAAGDQQGALFGQCCFDKGDMKNTSGTGCFMLLNTGNELVRSKNGLITTICAGTDDHPDYALEGSIFVAGAAIQWLRDQLRVIASAPESEHFAAETPDTAGAYVVPAFTGLGAPYWNQDARGTIVGITRGFSRAHLVKATLESIAYETLDTLRAMEQDAGYKVKGLKVDGGACSNGYLMQFQSDILACDVYRPNTIETTALGAAYLAGLAVGYWSGKEDLRHNWEVDKVFTPKMEESKRNALIKGWHKAVRCAMLWGEQD